MNADLLCTVAHPDDESFGMGSVLAMAATGGARVVVICATRGESGDDATGQSRTTTELGAARELELRRAAQELGLAEVEVLDFADSGWDGPTPAGALVDGGHAVVDVVLQALTRHQPQVVVTMDPSGSDGHRDHAAIGAATTAAFWQYRPASGSASLYHWCLVRSLMDRWAAERGLEAGVYAAQPLGRLDADVTTLLDTSALLESRRSAIKAHATQASPFNGLSADVEIAFLTKDHLIRVVPPWTGGPTERALVGPDRAVRLPDVLLAGRWTTGALGKLAGTGIEHPVVPASGQRQGSGNHES